MFDFSILISLLVAISVFYFSIYINFKKEIDDYKAMPREEHNNIGSKIRNRKKKLFLLNIITAVILFIIILLFFYHQL